MSGKDKASAEDLHVMDTVEQYESYEDYLDSQVRLVWWRIVLMGVWCASALCEERWSGSVRVCFSFFLPIDNQHIPGSVRTVRVLQRTRYSLERYRCSLSFVVTKLRTNHTNRVSRG